MTNFSLYIYECLRTKNMKGRLLRDTLTKQKYNLASSWHFPNIPIDKLTDFENIIKMTIQTYKLIFILPNSLPKTSLSPVWFIAILHNCNKLTTSFTIMPSCGLSRSSFEKISFNYNGDNTFLYNLFIY